MNVSVGARSRPAIEPIRTDVSLRDLKTRGWDRYSIADSPAWSATSTSPLLPIYPRLHDEQMQQHDKELVDRLRRSSHNSFSPDLPTPRISLTPISELALSPPVNAFPSRLSPLSPSCPDTPAFSSPSSARSMQNPGIQTWPQDEELAPGAQAYRRRSITPGALTARNARLQRHQEHVRRRRSTTIQHSRKPDLLIIPVGLRRPSSVAPDGPAAGPVSPLPQDGRYTVRVLIHSRDRKPAILTRKFDIGELRATLSTQRVSPIGRRASMAATVTSPLSSSRVMSMQRAARRHSSSAINGPDMAASPSTVEQRGPMQGKTAIPIHLEYARAYLPVLAAIILSDMVRPGDMIELPLPNPLAWEDTVAYIYTGCKELTEPIRQNILYLGGDI